MNGLETPGKRQRQHRGQVVVWGARDFTVSPAVKQKRGVCAVHASLQCVLTVCTDCRNNLFGFVVPGKTGGLPGYDLINC